ncbi:MAP3K epsilon protein kinase 1-like [Lytechinus variegatus]|uniref:MAP3K epsilon protein kinase 1-like n=1 Tax=Lytechinus variegatus TaxID=7654 RepID=UPI001BB24F10|nr:MAP3K epsilon protein kinase 1-like [Lytechinus variegatus]
MFGDLEEKCRTVEHPKDLGEIPIHLDVEGISQKEYDSSRDLLNALEYDCQTLKEQNQALRDLIEIFRVYLRNEQGPFSNIKNTADAAVIATIGSLPCTELNMNDVITFHATSVIDNDFKFKEIGRGAFGRVLLARHTSSSDTVVIKGPVIPPFFSPDKIESQRRSNLGQFTKEAVASEFLSRSRHFPKFYGTLMLDGDMCIVQEFIGDKKTGKVFPLLNIMKCSPSPFLSCLSLLGIAVDVLEGIAFMHSNRLLHNDIKADNVLLEFRNNHWQGFIIDLGLVSTIAFPPRITINESIMENHKKLSVIFYLAPEVVDDGAALSLASDIYSVGVLLGIIGRAARSQDLISIGNSCSRNAPMLRPRSLNDVLYKVQSLQGRLALEKK